MAGLPMMTKTSVLSPSMAFPRPQSSPSGLRSSIPAWQKSSRVSFTALSAAKEDTPKGSADQLKESFEGAASAVSKKFEEDKTKTEGDVEKAGGKAQEIHETLKEAGETAADKAQKDVEGAWDAAKGTTDKILETLGGKEGEK